MPVRRRTLLAVPAAALVVALTLWAWPRVAPGPASSSHRGPAPSSPQTSAPTPSSVAGAASRTTPIDFADRTTAVHERCDLDLTTHCADGACIALVTAPDLDRPSGWASLLTRSPRFVLSTALRDLGLPASTLPCGEAIDALVGQGEVRAVELADGTEVWCLADGDPAAGAALCSEQAAAAVGLSAARFDDPTLRRLEFDRSDR